MKITLTDETDPAKAVSVATTEKKGTVKLEIGGKEVTVKANDLQKAIRAAS